MELCHSTPLRGQHVELGAKMVPFAGWEMPVQYSQGILAEHRHTREKVSLFDTCHMGQFVVTGGHAGVDLGRLVSSGVERLEVGACKYGLLLDDHGGIIDDTIVARLAQDRFLVVVNAGTREGDAEWIGEHLSAGTGFEDQSTAMGKLDLQGPCSMQALQPLCRHDLRGLRYFRCVQAEVCGFDALVSRTGYTGELGYEIYVAAECVTKVWAALLELPEVEPAGLGARDTLRLEVGYRLYGQDMDRERTPLEADLMDSVELGKEFIGREALQRQMAAGANEKLVGFVMSGRRAGRHGFTILADGEDVGKVTSGSFAPSLGVAVGMGYVRGDRAWQEGDALAIAIGSQTLPAKLTRPPFYGRGTARMKTTGP
ncbi:MAG TPA: glycine cleavage system aminomethyltransferase GcvT [Phycisphaerae bacterium]|nr:glycine cleavage system aminomethyltransferase GcvT [Phycisphaerae bacterium]